jgi:N6-adenosine-specific RNA methylase IME4
MYDTEHVLFGHIGSLPLVRLGLKLSFAAPTTGHSRKPAVFFERVMQASPEPRLDMFARQVHPGFAAWGNEMQHER